MPSLCMNILRFARHKHNTRKKNCGSVNCATSHAVNPRKEKNVCPLIFEPTPRLKENFSWPGVAVTLQILFRRCSFEDRPGKPAIFRHHSLRGLRAFFQANLGFYLYWVAPSSFQILSNSSSFVVLSSTLRIRSCEELWQIHELVNYFEVNGKQTAL